MNTLWPLIGMALLTPVFDNLNKFLFAFEIVDVNEIARNQQRLSAVIHDTLNSLRPSEEIGTKYFDKCAITDVCQTLTHYDYDGIAHDAADGKNKLRMGCCTPSDVRQLYNILLEGNKIFVFQKDGAPPPRVTSLPDITSVKKQRKDNFNIPLRFRKSNLPITEIMTNKSYCRSYFNGSLHIIGSSTIHNVYHAVGDNILPLIAQIILDAYLAPQMLHLPRMFLQYGSGSDSISGHHKQSRNGVPHLDLLHKLTSAGSITLAQADGMCFRRVVWGHGPHVLYQDSLVTLRRLSAAFARQLALRCYNLTYPLDFLSSYSDSSKNEVNEVPATTTTIDTSSSSGTSKNLNNHNNNKVKHTKKNGRLLFNDTNTSNGTSSHRRLIQLYSGSRTSSDSVKFAENPMQSSSIISLDNQRNTNNNNGGQLRGLNIVFFTRGSSGRGRTMQGEELLLQRLLKEGARAVLCCDFNAVTAADQLALAVHADVIIGLHGAAMVHGIFMRPGSISIEWKTLYGYDSNLFSLVADARTGVHGQVDVRKYFVKGGHRPVDLALTSRTVHVLKEALNLQQEREADGLLLNQLPTSMTSSSSFVLKSVSLPSTTSSSPSVTFSSSSSSSSSFAITPGDMVVRFPDRYDDTSVMHLLGPLQSNHSQVCKAMPFAKLRAFLGVDKDGNSFHCHMCTTYVVR